MPDSRTILVTGATGRQGGATVRRLLADGWRVRALVRDRDAAPARTLARAGAELAAGDLDDPDSLAAAAAGAHGVFGVTPNEPDPRREVAQGRALIDAARGAGVGHFVFSSVGGAERATGLPQWESKWEVEQYLRAGGLRATVLRPVRFMENHAVAAPVGGMNGDTLVHVFAPDVPVQLIAVADIAAFAALAFADPARSAGEAVELAGDELTPAEAVVHIGRAVGREIGYRQWRPGEPTGMGEEFDRVLARALQGMTGRPGGRGFWQADVAALRRRHPGMLDFATWLRRGGAQDVAAVLEPRDVRAEARP